MSDNIPALTMTPGPWRWEINPKGRTIRLCGGLRPKYDQTVMDFVRWGMMNAQPRFISDGLMCNAEEFKRVAPDRQHHATWFQLLNHPDANLIAAAPELLAALKSIVPAFNTARIIMQDKEARDLAGELVAEARAVIDKAEGRS